MLSLQKLELQNSVNNLFVGTYAAIFLDLFKPIYFKLLAFKHNSPPVHLGFESYNGYYVQ